MEADGVVYVEVTDRRQGQSFRFYDFEHTVAMAMDGRPLPDVARDLRENAELDLSPEQLSAFAEQLKALGFLEEGGAEAAAPTPAAPAELPELTLGPPADEAPNQPATVGKRDDSEGIPSFFPPLAADESGHFSGATIGMAAIAMDRQNPGAALDSSLPASPVKPEPAAAGVDPAASIITPPPVMVTPAAVRPLATGPVAPGIDRTLTSFPPEVLPGQPSAREKKAAATETKAESAPPATTTREKTPPPITARDLPREPVKERTRVPLSELGGARERTPPPVPVDARVSVPAQKPARPESDDALTTEMDVVSFMADGTPAPPPAEDDPMGGEITSAGMDLSQFHVDEMDLDAAFSAAKPASMAGAPAPDPQAVATSGPVTVPTAKPTSGPTATPTAAANLGAPDAPIPVHVSEPSAPVPGDFAHVVAGAEAAVKNGHAASNAPAAPQADTPSGRHEADPRERPTQELQAVQLSVRFADPASGETAVPGLAAEAPAEAEAEAEAEDRPAGDDPEAAKPARLITPFATSDAPAEEQRPRAATPWKTYAIYAALALAAAAVITVMGLRLLESPAPNRVTVDTLNANPQNLLRYWDANAKVVVGTASALSFSGDGKVAELAAVGTKFAPGDVLALLDSGRKFRAEYSHNNDRLTHYQGLLEKMTAAGNRPEMRQAELKIAEKKRLMAEAQANLAKHAIIATDSGEVAEAAVKLGDQVKAGDPILRSKGANFRAVFELPRDQAEKARQLGFCKAEIDGKQLECSLAAEGGDETHVPIDLPNDPAVAEGKTVRLARDRLEAVYTVPTSALVRVGDSDRIYVVQGQDRDLSAELRAVVVADRGPEQAIITQGLEAGDRVILNPPPGLEPNSQVLVAKERR
ncbi:MAG TPA: hypothetical protein VGF45_14005 [Polyangia bacterium]